MGISCKRVCDVTLMPHAKHTWYYGANIPATSRLCRMPVAARYRAICDDIAKQKYIGFKLGETDTGDVWSAPRSQLMTLLKQLW